MNRNLPTPGHTIPQALANLVEIGAEGYRQKLPRYLFLAICFNLILAPIVSASNHELARTQAWALGLLGLGTIALSIYLFFVMFVPEKF